MRSRITAGAVLALAALSLSACTSVAEPAPTPPPGTSEPAASQSPVPNAPNLNRRGHVEQTVGAGDTIVGSKNEDLVTVTVLEAKADFTCTAPNAPAPKNGHYVALTVQLVPAAAFADELSMFPVGTHDFQVLKADGTPESDSWGNGAACITAAETLPAVVTADGPTKGLIILDTAEAAGSVLYVPGGWEWPF